MKFRESVALYMKASGLATVEAAPLYKKPSDLFRDAADGRKRIGSDLEGLPAWSFIVTSHTGVSRYPEASDRAHELAKRNGTHGAVIALRHGGDTVGQSFVIMRLDDFSELLVEHAREDS